MQRVFVNLITNCYIHNDEQIKLTIAIAENSDGIYITISDNGKGVKPDELDSIFNRYYRGTNTRQQKEGSGLGLSIAHDIIVAHQGSITACNVAPHGLKLAIHLI